MRISFVYPFFLQKSALEREWMMPYFPLGLLYLASAARQAGHTVAVFDGTFAKSETTFVEHLTTFQPEVVCIASLITLRSTALELGQMSAKRGSRVVFGGADPSNDPKAYLGDEAIIVLNEGEATLVDLLKALEHSQDLTQIDGLAFQTSDGIYQTSAREPLWDLETLPMPARDLLDMAPYFEAWRTEHRYTSLTIAASRGCPYGCEYCAQSATGIHFRRRSPQHVAREMKIIEAQYAPDRFRLVDDLEGLGENWLRELGQAMLALGVQTPYEGLQGVSFTDLPMYEAGKGLCGKRNRYIPRVSDHPHAPPALNLVDLQARWGAGVLPQDA